MNKPTYLMLPPGRFVMGDLYDPQTTDAEGNPLLIKTGVNKGQPTQKYFFAVAIPKGTEQHWAQTPWGQKIWEVAHADFPNGQPQSPTFAWKITDGDSQVPNKAGNKPCDRDGYPHCWVVSLSTSFAPKIVNADGTQQIVEKDAVLPGYYLEVYIQVAGNGSMQQPGVFLNPRYVALTAYGEPIVFGVDPKTLGFGKNPLPVGASATPVARGFNPAPPASVAPAASLAPAYVPPQVAQAPIAPQPTVAVQPYAAILTPPPASVAPPAPTAPNHVMTSLAKGSYEACIAAGWTDALLVQHGWMQA